MAVIRLSALGDVTLTTGVLLYWYKTFGSTFTVLTKAGLAPVFDHHPAVSRVLELDPDDLHGERQRTLFQLLADDFQGITLVDLHGTLRTLQLARAWKGPVFRYPKQAVQRRLFLLTKGRLFQDTLLRYNVPQRYAQALEPRGESVPAPQALLPKLFLTEDEMFQADVMLAPLLAPLTALNMDEVPPVVALHPFATHASKTWPLETWLQFASLLKARDITYFWVGKGEALPTTHATQDFTNKTDLRQLSALLAHADALVTGDSGPMHLAGGVGTPVVALFGPTSREWGFFPAGARDKILQAPVSCRPCSLHGKTSGSACPYKLACLTSLAPELVADALADLLARNSHPKDAVAE